MASLPADLAARLEAAGLPTDLEGMLLAARQRGPFTLKAQPVGAAPEHAWLWTPLPYGVGSAARSPVEALALGLLTATREQDSIPWLDVPSVWSRNEATWAAAGQATRQEFAMIAHRLTGRQIEVYDAFRRLGGKKVAAHELGITPSAVGPVVLRVGKLLLAAKEAHR